MSLKDVFAKLQRRKKEESPEDIVKKGIASAPESIRAAMAMDAFNFATKSGLMEGLEILKKNALECGRALEVSRVYGDMDYVWLRLNIPSMKKEKIVLDPKTPLVLADTTDIFIKKKQGIFSSYYEVRTTTATAEIRGAFLMLPGDYQTPIAIVEKNACKKSLAYIAKRAKEEKLVI